MYNANYTHVTGMLTVIFKKYNLDTFVFDILNIFLGFTVKDYFKSCLKCSSLTILIWLATLLTIALLSLTVVLLDRCLSWFAQPVWLLFLYIIPSILVPMVLLTLFGRKFLWVRSYKMFKCILFKARQ